MIKQIKVSQYRCFHSLDIELNQHQVLAGANGSGKTTLLDIPTLFGELLASNDINQVFFEPTPSQNYARASNPIELIHNLQGNCFSLSLAVQIPAHIKDSLLNSFVNFQPETVRYELLFEIVANEKLQIAQEYLFLSSSAAENNFSVIQRRNGENSTLFQAEGQPQTFNFTISKEQLALSSMPADHRFF